MERLIKILKPLKQRILLQQAINFALFYFCCIFLIDALIIIVNKFIFINKFVFYLFLIDFVVIVIFLIIFFKNIPSVEKIAVQADKLGFSERFITLLELIKKGESNIFVNMIFDGIVNNKNYIGFEKLYKINIKKKYLKLLALSFFVIGISLIIPYSKSDFFLEKLKLNDIIEEKVEKIEEIEKDINADSPEKKEVLKTIESVKKEIKNAENENQVKDIAQNTQYELKKIEKKYKDKDLSEIADKLNSIEQTKGISNEIKNENIENINSEINNFYEDIKNMNEEQKTQLKNEIANISNQLSDENKLKSNISEISGLLSENKDISKSLSKLSENISQIVNDKTELDKIIDNINNTLSDDKNLNEYNTLENKDNLNSDKDVNSNSNKGVNSSSDKGINSNSGNSNSNVLNSQNSNQPGKGHIENEQQSSSNSENNSIDFNLKGIQNENKNNQIIEIEGSGNAGESIKYQQVYGKYKQEALNSIENGNIPFEMKEIVKNYFSTLE